MRKILITYIFCSLFSFAIAQQYNFRNYNADDGLPHSQVSSIYQDSKGYLWLTLYGPGVCRFDGRTFTPFGKKEGMQGKLARPVTQDANGNMWFGTLGDGLWKYDGKQFTQLVTKELSKDEKIYSLVNDKQNNLWIGTDSGVSVYDGKIIKHFTAKDGLPEKPVQGLFCDKEGRVWMGVWQDGLYYYQDGKFHSVDDEEGLLKSSVMCIYEDTKGTLWFGTFNSVVRAEWKGSELQMQRMEHPALQGLLTYSILDDEKGNIWFATNGNGLVKYNVSSKKFTPVTVKNGLPCNTVLSLVLDKEQNIWVSCWGFGIARYSGERFIHYTAKDGFPGNTVNAIAKGDNGDILLSTTPGITVLHKDGTVQPYKKEDQDKLCYWMLRERSGALWLSFDNELIRIENGKQNKFTAKDGIAAMPAHYLTEDKQGNIWFGSWAGGLTCYNGKEFINYGAKDGLNSNYIYSMFADSKGDLWVCTWDEGVCRYDGNKFTYFKKEQGLPDNNVVSAAEDSKGNIWFATYGGGITRYDGKSFTSISSSDGLSDDACNAIILDDKEQLWVSTNKGLDRIDVPAFNASGKIMIRHYGREEGFTALESARNAVYMDDAHHLWFGTKRGLTRFDAGEDRINKLEPRTHISSIQLFFNDVNWNSFSDSVSPATGLPSGLELPYDQNHLTFRFIGISTTVPEKVQYRYMLEGLDKDWSPLTSKTDATYSGIPPGEYIFRVKAANNEGVWNSEPVSFPFTVLPPFWRTTWFFTLCGLMVFGGFYTYVKVRTRQLVRTRRVLAQKVRERTEEVVEQKNYLEVAYREIEAKNVLVEQKNRDITDSINYALRIQKAILPLTENIRKALPHSFIMFRPKDIVSGDFYWFAEKDGKVLIAAADCTGHGVPGAFMSMIGNDQLNHIVIEKGMTDPSIILNELNKAIKRALKQTEQESETRDGMDIALLAIDLPNKKLQFAGANRPLILVRDRHLMETRADKVAIGGRTSDDYRFTGHEVELQANDSIYIFSDGYADQFGGVTGKKFMTKNFKELLVRIHELPVSEQEKMLEVTMDQWRNDLEQVDDILVIGIRF